MRKDSRQGLREVLVLAGALALAIPFVATSDIRNTKHNLSRGEGGDAPVSPGSAKEVCVFCHTPSVSSDVSSAQTPLWQAAAQNSEFIMFDHLGRGNQAQHVGTQSIACLSCHDGLQAMNIASRVAFDHPFGVPYRGYKAASSENEKGRGAEKDSDPTRQQRDKGYSREATGVVNDDFVSARSALQGTHVIWWVPVGSAAPTRGKGDLPLYGRSVEEGQESVPFVECSTCHDPHSESRKFLRVAAKGSGLCVSCHAK